ncbi:SPOR domain-containing protein [Chondromyces apiculatus]|uniref:Adventurous gliding motility protein AgmI n=1 Tax=Chondromyces apiculatus DSM 436 TaxID=1192034 RepID=A0A017TFY8_9BACT|nr:SPOR domain-containing protein [Chondromyces apiculatus]EYF07842.1 adventurous gliding motility protein AgmI [Chondromyces apiculatus DSM 436]
MSRRADIVDPGAIRNLDQIQETEAEPRPSRAGALVLASLGGACIVFAAVALLRAPSSARPVPADPLGDLVARTHPAGQKIDRKPGIGQDVTFPSTLSDAQNPTTALEAVREKPKAAPDLPFPLPPGAPTEPPPATDKLPVVALPAQVMLEPVTSSKDALTTMARHVSREEGQEVAVGAAGSYQLQVSSFKDQPDAEKFAAALRRRGHHAYVEPAYVKGRGLWHRVRIGPFKHKHSAVIYRQEFEAKERIVTFIIDPPKTTVKVRETQDDDV